ncbi:MAG: sugar phosphate isomerase/epimerase [Nanoarchaeota archaeon]|nr:sugar phosphate isomerase/epimerase [Nanoarchaeota archaeon]MBU1322116.1 sugar phosphate isomerase/epimerase [Nanoarchaeota archaeon]MBU1597437.1 sugar phosphate isomerase/epimerase [Nanoarchaeota archaeon]MBU2441606.1 sugar phosphate isomerase/epimerase [Nanoarchaeota archaeon]
MIGISSKNAFSAEFWWNTLIDKGFKLLELNHRVTPISFNPEHITGMKEIIKNNDLTITIHSGVTDILHPDEITAEYQLLLLKAEIKYASDIGMNHVIFHMSSYLDHEKDKDRIHEFLSEVIEFARIHDVKLFLENDSKGAWVNPDDLLPYFEKYKNLKHLLDIGHLNRALHSGFVKSEKDYFDKLGKHICYVHIHGNKGIIDEHTSVDKGNLKLDFLLPEIKKLNPIVIIETNNMEDALITEKILQANGFE